MTRDEALIYSENLIRMLCEECDRTKLRRKSLCIMLGISEPTLSKWVLGSRTCQLYYVIKTAEDVLSLLKQKEDRYYAHNK